ncbi:phytanoyl-CoA dioxygenase family protein [Phenylobacterium sp. 20VBR1]|uniref:Phytanoyl-CoA dioxygenase family protein n=1 Tax=Phenylobacterium glaciei TaxID=2803784 RepID=A0A941HXU8_9CAUL|nr:phytanoyl-CoA dioxygenase family protein [Phenylobacterium glaciei]MBR7620790.1 phytanoyl-CoA dioxygenase family protein [Phenylobacterium glaciei]
MAERFGPEHVEAWRRDGGLVIERFFTEAEVAAVVADFEKVWGPPPTDAQALDKKKEGEVGRFNPAQFTMIQPVPIDCSPALNLIGVHPAIVAFAKAALKTDKVHVYQCQAWAKFTGEADYDQPFHCDFVNHTLTAPSEDSHLNSITILCYFSDVTDAHGPAHFVTRPDAQAAAAPEETLSQDPDVQARIQAGLLARSRSSAGPAGSIFPYTIDVYHRGTNLTAPGGHRYALMTCFKAAGNEAIAFTPWAHTHMKPWRNIFDNATPEQLACFGVPEPGDPFWTEVTLQRTQARYPGWNSAAYRAAITA